jgi:hypothetical protein
MCDGYESSFPFAFLNCHLHIFLHHLFCTVLFNITEYNVILNYYKVLWVKQWMKNDRNSQLLLNPFSAEGENAQT